MTLNQAAAIKPGSNSIRSMYRLRNKERGLCPCGHLPPRPGFVKCELCAKKRKEEYARDRHKVLPKAISLYYERRKEVIEHYGSKCVCCGETYFPFLQLDHINGNGSQHSKKVGRGNNMYNWVIRNGFPEGVFQILCANCNFAKWTRKACPCKERLS